MPCRLLLVLMLFAATQRPGDAANPPKPPPHPRETSERICLSLRALATAITRDSISATVDTLDGMGWVDGFVEDPKDQDVILFGRTAPGWPTLHLEDLAVLMRNIWHSDPEPSCSLDPRRENVIAINAFLATTGSITDKDEIRQIPARLEELWGPLTVVVGGIPRDSRCAHVMIDADNHMKEVSQGLVAVPGVRSCLDIMLEESRRQVKRSWSLQPMPIVMSRFWFHVGNDAPSFRVASGVVELDRCPVVLLTERQRAGVDGALYNSEENDSLAIVFTREFTEKLSFTTVQVREYADLENLFRLYALLRAVRIQDAAGRSALNPDPFLRDYVFREQEPMPSSQPASANGGEFQIQKASGSGFTLFRPFLVVCGGVSLEMKVEDGSYETAAGDELVHLSGAILAARPDPGSLSWRFNEP